MPVNHSLLNALQKEYGKKRGKSVYYKMEQMPKHKKLFGLEKVKKGVKK